MQSRRDSGAEPQQPIPLDITNHLGYMARASSPRTQTRRTPVHRRLPCPHRQRGRRGTHKARAVIPPHRRCTLAPDAADRMRRAFRSPLPPRQEMATAPPGGELRGRPSARHDAAARQAGFPSCEPFPACRPVADRGHPRQVCPCLDRASPEGPSRSAAAQRKSGRSPGVLAIHARRPTAARPARVP
jgi:hypothetical protein